MLLHFEWKWKLEVLNTNISIICNRNYKIMCGRLARNEYRIQVWYACMYLIVKYWNQQQENGSTLIWLHMLRCIVSCLNIFPTNQRCRILGWYALNTRWIVITNLATVFSPWLCLVLLPQNQIISLPKMKLNMFNTFSPK